MYRLYTMAPDPRCAALNNAKQRKGEYLLCAGLGPLRSVAICSIRFPLLDADEPWKFAAPIIGISYGDIAAKIGQTEQHVIDICTAKATPTQAEFDAIAKVLGITDAPPANRAHATTS
ncbi:hypothetical protein D9757_004026 [Collybiopsis confluens]|uniref:Uncharacterized protein n=1 Tax=Collybiopsis confluens TaxID=2823264 RepID=A0A8H5MEN4_9AGAR|nr:hypothetical protein D9757_004026 [Collybiopsis confluens]